MRKSVLLVLVVLLFHSCQDYKELGNVDCMVPVYFDPDDATAIKTSAPRAFGDLGGIAERGDYIYLTEKLEGIHVVDNSDPNVPVTVLFWEVPGINLFTLDADRLYADNGRHLWVIDITDINNIKVVDKEEDIFLGNEEETVLRPPDSYNGYFECVDRSRGIVIDWKMETIENPKCKTL